MISKGPVKACSQTLTFPNMLSSSLAGERFYSHPPSWDTLKGKILRLEKAKAISVQLLVQVNLESHGNSIKQLLSPATSSTGYHRSVCLCFLSSSVRLEDCRRDRENPVLFTHQQRMFCCRVGLLFSSWWAVCSHSRADSPLATVLINQ